MKVEKSNYQVWECKIVIPQGALPSGFDSPPRQAVISAIEAAGFEVIAASTGWGGELTDSEEECMLDNLRTNSGDKYYAGTLDAADGDMSPKKVN